MKWPEFWLILIVTAVCNAAGRVLPLFLLHNRPLSARLQKTIMLIPSACFAALVANDLFSPAAFAGGFNLLAFVPILSAVPVVLVSLKTRSLFTAVLCGLCAYALMFFLC
jgi:branched-subunit amino acid transport protein